MKGCGFSLFGGTIAGIAGYTTGKSNGYENGRENGFEQGRQRGILAAGGIDPTTNDEKIRDVDKEITVQPDDYHSVSFTFNHDRTLLTYSVVADGYLDIVFMSKKSFEEYRNENDPQYMMKHSDLDTSRAIRKEVVFGEGEYVLVLDNTSYGRATPTNPVEVGYALKAYQRD